MTSMKNENIQKYNYYNYIASYINIIGTPVLC